MRYLGGKSRLGGQIVRAILADLGVSRLTLVADLCSGPGNVTHRLADVSDRVVAVEAHPGLVALLRAIQSGWAPPENVSRDEYYALKTNGNPADPLTAFVGFGCSFKGGWWAGYAQPKGPRPRNLKGDNYAWQSATALQRDSRANVEHVNGDALAWEPPSDLTVAYCDPEYEGTTGYAAVAGVACAGDAWWRKMRSLADRGIAAFLSEYADAPPPGVAARLVWSAPTHKTQLTKGTKVERLWRVLPGVHTPPAGPPSPTWPAT